MAGIRRRRRRRKRLKKRKNPHSKHLLSQGPSLELKQIPRQLSNNNKKYLRMRRMRTR